MSVFTKRREDEQIQRPAGMPPATAGQPSVANAVAATPPPPRATPPAASATTVFGSTFTIKGEISGDEDVRIDGRVEGRVDLGRNRLVVGANGNVHAAITAREVDVHGVVNGNVAAAGKIILRKNSKLVGELKMASVEIEDGAYFKGSIDITRPPEASAVAAPASPAPQSHAAAPSSRP